MSERLHADRLRALIDAGGLIVSDLDLDSVLGRVLGTACELTGARYAALGVLNTEQTGLERFITHGIDEATARTIGELPHGRGVLGQLILDPRPLRLSRVGDHHASYGFPYGHPAMQTFLGVPVLVRERVWGNLYLTDKRSGEFGQDDEDVAVILARWAGIAVENARLYHDAQQRRAELERTIANLQATQAIALAVGAETDLDRVLELIVKRGRALVNARTVVILLRDRDELVLVASAGHAGRPRGERIAIAGSTSGEVMRRGRPERVTDVERRLRISTQWLGVSEAASALLVPLAHRGQPVGVLIAFDRGTDGAAFREQDEQTLKAFAASAATAVATAQVVQQHRVRDALAAAEGERRRWAQELHDETLQALGGLRVLLSSARRSGSHDLLDEATGAALTQIEQEITNLRAIITELRPAALDALGLAPALEALFDRHRSINDLAVAADLNLPEGLSDELQAAVYRVVQEALTNVVKHSGARRVTVTAAARGGHLILHIGDDGRGFAVGAGHDGFGLTGMSERVSVIGGELSIESGPSGTTVTASLPLCQPLMPRAAASPAAGA